MNASKVLFGLIVANIVTRRFLGREPASLWYHAEARHSYFFGPGEQSLSVNVLVADLLSGI